MTADRTSSPRFFTSLIWALLFLPISTPIFAASETVEEGLDALRQGNFAEAFCIWRPLANAGDAEAAYNLGWLYANGNGLRVDVEKAIRWWEAAAMQGHLEAQFTLGLTYTTGEGIKKDTEAALRWFLKAARGGQTDAQEIIREFVQVGSSLVDEHLNGILQLPWIGDRLRVKVKRANLRAGPGTGNEIVETVTEGSELVEIGHHGNWSYIINPDTKKRGWIADWLTVRTTP